MKYILPDINFEELQALYHALDIGMDHFGTDDPEHDILNQRLYPMIYRAYIDAYYERHPEKKPLRK